jgi:hypothetical protein
MTLNTPGGIPACRASSATRDAENDVNSEGFKTKLLPIANAGASFRMARTRGKFQPTMPATTPIGRRSWYERLDWSTP